MSFISINENEKIKKIKENYNNIEESKSLPLAKGKAVLVIIRPIHFGGKPPDDGIPE